MSLTITDGHVTRPPAELIQTIKGHLANLRNINLTLIPRDLRLRNDDTWGPQPLALLEALYLIERRVRVRLGLRWNFDCERFEREYCGRGRWKILDEEDDLTVERGPYAQDWRSVVYQLH